MSWAVAQPFGDQMLASTNRRGGSTPKSHLRASSTRSTQGPESGRQTLCWFVILIFAFFSNCPNTPFFFFFEI